jgi:hypothetical protein
MRIWRLGVSEAWAFSLVDGFVLFGGMLTLNLARVRESGRGM